MADENEMLKQLEKERIEVEGLDRRIAEESPESGAQLSTLESFKDLAISHNTLRALERGKFTQPTQIQIGAIPHGLANRDILGAAKTGSGKTLAFLIPLVEKLYRLRWGPEDGLGALVITPTRELALQIFEVLRTVGRFHTFSAGLVIGGKNFSEEQYRIVTMNIIVATPGRLLQHMEQTPGFDLGNLELLIFDEADRLLDMGFSTQLSSLLSYLPTTRQTMLFSATQTKSVRDLARLSLVNPEYVAVHAKSESATPASLVQRYVVCPLDTKFEVLFSFLKSHLKHKIIVFASTSRQVQFMYESFCKMQPGVPLLSLHGKFSQGKRVDTYYHFLNKPSACLFATDLASRGLDFPKVDWIVQFDCPEDVPMYIHRAGRTARFDQGGHCLTLLLPSEEGAMTEAWTGANIPVSSIQINPKKTFSTRQKFASLVASDRRMKTLAEKAFQSYVRSIQLQPNKRVFQLHELPIEAFAHSLGLAGVPAYGQGHGDDITDREALRTKKNVNRKLQKFKDKIKAEKAAKKLLKQQQLGVDEEPKEPEQEEEDDLLRVKRVHHWNHAEDDDDADDDDRTGESEHSSIMPVRLLSKNKKLKIRHEGTGANSKLLFDEEGEGKAPMEWLMSKQKEQEQSNVIVDIKEASERHVEKVAQGLKARDQQDREHEKERIRAKHLKKKMKNRALREEEEGGGGCQLASQSSSNEGSSLNDEDEEDSSSDEEIVDTEALALELLQRQH